MSRARWRRLIGLPWLDDEIVPDAANVQSPAVRVETSPISERATSEPAAVSLSPSGAGRTVETTILNAPRLNDDPPALRLGVTLAKASASASQYIERFSSLWAAFGPLPPIEETGAEAGVEWTCYPAPGRDWQSGPTPVLGVGPTMPMRSLSDDNHDRVWIAQGDHIEAMGVGDTPQEAAIEYARAVADLLRPQEGDEQ